MEITSQKNTERALRLRDNKRRHRARQKEHTADLERRLRKLQQEGVQAAKEIQLSARKVAQENERLRRLLRHVGVGEETINSWTVGEKGKYDGEVLDHPLKRPCLRTAGGGTCGQANTDLEDARQKEHIDPEAIARDAPSEQACFSCPAKMDPRNTKSPTGNENPETANESSALENGRPVDDAALPYGGPPGACESQTNRGRENSLRGVSVSDNMSTSTPSPSAPCKLLTLLAANPSADITQVPLASDEKEPNPDVVDDGISCSRAYQMLIHYATTEPKLDAVAHILEEGCVPNLGPGGGCRVKSQTIWKALDDTCL